MIEGRARRGELRDHLRRERAQQRHRHRRQVAGSDPARSSSSSSRAPEPVTSAGLTAQAVADLVGGRLLGDGAVVVRAVGPLDRAGPGRAVPGRLAPLRGRARGPPAPGRCWCRRGAGRGRRGPRAPGSWCADPVRRAGAGHRRAVPADRTAARRRSHRPLGPGTACSARRDHRPATSVLGRGCAPGRPLPAGRRRVAGRRRRPSARTP